MKYKFILLSAALICCLAMEKESIACTGHLFYGDFEQLTQGKIVKIGMFDYIMGSRTPQNYQMNFDDSLALQDRDMNGCTYSNAYKRVQVRVQKVS